jgi:tRNA threonylcarbamoyladenosine biosynthesis protein TsaE
MKIISKSVDDTVKAGIALAGKLKRGDVVALFGEFGSGKTIFTKGIAKGLGVKDIRYVNSPSFVIIKEYKGKVPLYHFDLYRLDKAHSLDSVGYDEYFYGNGVTVIEWAERVAGDLPSRHVEAHFSVTGEHERTIKISRKPIAESQK